MSIGGFDRSSEEVIDAYIVSNLLNNETTNKRVVCMSACGTGRHVQKKYMYSNVVYSYTYLYSHSKVKKPFPTFFLAPLLEND